jgi:ABC-type Mn2+/Zn2+ transport system permease subunit
MIFITSGIAVSYSSDLPGGPVIILIAGAAYLLVALATKLRKRHSG